MDETRWQTNDLTERNDCRNSHQIFERIDRIWDCMSQTSSIITNRFNRPKHFWSESAYATLRRTDYYSCQSLREIFVKRRLFFKLNIFTKRNRYFWISEWNPSSPTSRHRKGNSGHKSPLSNGGSGLRCQTRRPADRSIYLSHPMQHWHGTVRASSPENMLDRPRWRRHCVYADAEWTWRGARKWWWWWRWRNISK